MGADALGPPRSMAMVWLESAPSRLVTTVEVVGELVSPPSKTTTPAARVRRVGRVDDHQVAGGHAVAGFENQARLEGDVVDEGAVLAAQVLHRPIVAFRFEREVLAREAGIFGKAKLGGAGAADGHGSVSGERDGLGLPHPDIDDEFTSHVSVL